jgi:serine/threonine protein kinase/WD40 repeat protein
MAIKEISEESIFNLARKLDSGAIREVYLCQACGDNAELRTRVQALLDVHEQEKDFLASPAGVIATCEEPGKEGLGTLIGPYKLMEQIGEGGMGVVFVAEQQHPVRRKVAVKVIKPGMDTREVIARFEAERQALALMDHPNIARVFDAGATESGRPYFVMELVRGVGIMQFCDENRLTLRQRLELFVHVCQAVQHAHQKGIIHRDLKATNILVTLHDGTPVVKVIDFGVAKAIGQQLTDKTIYTRFTQMIGTPMYMSPEQAEMSGLDIDTRSDIYALGVLLYELLTGATPFDNERLRTAPYDEIRRIVREEEPPRPSQRISTLLADALTAVSAQRRTDPKRLSQLCRGELDWIVMKALEKDRNRRYETASAFAADVERYLKDEPVQACPPSAGYRLRKFFRRYKGAVLAASLLVLVLVGGIIGTTLGMLRATDAEAHAVTEAKQKEDALQEKEAALQEKEAALTAAQRSKRDADEKLFDSYLAQARAFRMSRRSGQRFESLEVLKRATELARALGLPAAKFDLLRNAVIASLALPDLHLTGPWHPWPADSYTFDFDEAHALYARTDQRGDCSVRRVADDAELHHLPGLDGRAGPVFSRDGQFVAVVHLLKGETGATGMAVQLWALEQPAARLIRTEKKARHVDFHRNGGQVAMAYNDGTIGLFELPSGRPVGRPLAPDTLTREVGIALHPTEPLVAVCSYFGRVVQLRDVRTGEVVASLPQSGGATHATWHPDGQTLAVGHADPPLILLYDRTTLQPYRTLEAAAAHLTFNHAGDRLAARGWAGTMGLFDVGTGQKLFGAAGAPLRFSRDDRRLAGGLQDGKLGTLQVGDSREYRTLVRKAMPKKEQYQAVALSPDGRLLAAGMSDGFGLWDLASGSELAFMPMDEGINGVTDLRFEQSGALLTAGYSGLLRWPVRADPKAPDRLLVGPPERLLPRAEIIGQSQGGRVTVVSNRAVGQWQAHAGGWILHADRPSEPIPIDAGADILPIAVDPDGKWVVTVSFVHGVAKIWDAHDGRLVKQLAKFGAGAPQFSPDGRWLYTTADGGRLFAVGTWAPGPRVGVVGLFAPDSRLMAIQPTNDVGRLLDRATGMELARLEDPDFQETSLHLFSHPDGTKLIGVGKGICVWDLRLIRKQLKDMGLDWNYPDFPPADPVSRAERPWTVEILPGDLAKPIPLGGQSARQAIAHYRLAIKANPDDANACNSLAWVYLTAPEALRDVKAGLLLAEKAVRLDSANTHYRNTLGVAYYRAGKYREAVEVLRPNLAKQTDKGLALDLYVLAMSHHRLGESARARDYYDLAVRWKRTQPGLSAGHLDELTLFQAEAEELLKQESGAKSQESEKNQKPD